VMLVSLTVAPIFGMEVRFGWGGAMARRHRDRHEDPPYSARSADTAGTRARHSPVTETMTVARFMNYSDKFKIG